MAILFSAVSGVDPISKNKQGKCYDGNMLHIVRMYPDIDRVVLFFTSEFKDVFDQDKKSKLFCDVNGEFVDRYTFAVHKVREDITVSEPILTDITDPELIDSLDLLSEKLLETKTGLQKDEKLYVNISSGTPQMKTVLTLVANNIGADIIQVITPEKRINQPPDIAEKVCDRSEVNCDNGIFVSDRIKPQRLRFINKYVIEHKILGLIKGFQYCEAWDLYRNNRELISQQAGLLLEYAYLKTQLRFKEAQQIRGDIIDKIDFHGCTETEKNILEFLMLMKVHLAKDELYEFIIKMTPLLVEVVRIPFLKKFPYEKISDNPEKREKGKIKREIFEKNYPGMLAKLPAKLQRAIDEANFFTFNKMCACLSLTSDYSEFARKMLPLRKIEEKFRNLMAHNIATNISNRDLVLVTPYEDVMGIFKIIISGVQEIIGNVYDLNLSLLNTYTLLNDEINTLISEHKEICLQKDEVEQMDFVELKERAKTIGDYFISDDVDKEFVFFREKGRYGYLEYGQEHIQAELPKEYDSLGVEQKTIPVVVLEILDDAQKLVCNYSLCSLMGQNVLFYDEKLSDNKQKNCKGHIFGKCGNKIEAIIYTKNKPDVRTYCREMEGKSFKAKVVEYNNVEQKVVLEVMEKINENVNIRISDKSSIVSKMPATGEKGRFLVKALTKDTWRGLFLSQDGCKYNASLQKNYTHEVKENDNVEVVVVSFMVDQKRCVLKLLSDTIVQEDADSIKLPLEDKVIKPKESKDVISWSLQYNSSSKYGDIMSKLFENGGDKK